MSEDRNIPLILHITASIREAADATTKLTDTLFQLQHGKLMQDSDFHRYGAAQGLLLRAAWRVATDGAPEKMMQMVDVKRVMELIEIARDAAAFREGITILLFGEAGKPASFGGILQEMEERVKANRIPQAPVQVVRAAVIDAGEVISIPARSRLAGLHFPVAGGNGERDAEAIAAEAAITEKLVTVSPMEEQLMKALEIPKPENAADFAQAVRQSTTKPEERETYPNASPSEKTYWHAQYVETEANLSKLMDAIHAITGIDPATADDAITLLMLAKQEKDNNESMLGKYRRDDEHRRKALEAFKADPHMVDFTKAQQDLIAECWTNNRVQD